jgi:hypothetical protein
MHPKFAEDCIESSKTSGEPVIETAMSSTMPKSTKQRLLFI